MKGMFLKFLVVSAIVSSTLLLLDRTTQARGVPASAARPVNPACFSMNASKLTNICSTTQRVDIPVPIDASNNWHRGTVSAYGATASNNVGCELISIELVGNGYWATPKKWLPGFGASQLLDLGAVWVPNTGAMYFGCDVSPGGRINQVHWEQ